MNNSKIINNLKHQLTNQYKRFYKQSYLTAIIVVADQIIKDTDEIEYNVATLPYEYYINTP